MVTIADPDQSPNFALWSGFIYCLEFSFNRLGQQYMNIMLHNIVISYLALVFSETS